MEKRDPMLMFKSAKRAKIEIPKIKEVNVHNKVCKWLKIQYPNILFISDFAAGIKLSNGMGARQSLQKSNHAFPDIIIFEPRYHYHGLFIELKRDEKALYNKNGSFKKSEHLDRQVECHLELRKRGYKVEFACGFDEAVQLVREYLSKNNL